jgi:flagellar biosynthesis protein FlhB
MAENDQDQKTEQPTERHLTEAMERGQFAKVPELTVLLMIGAAAAVIAFTGRASAEALGEFAVTMFTRFPHIAVEREAITLQLGEIMLLLSRVLVPVVVACVGAALLAGGLQSGFQLSPKAIGFKLENLSPVAGFGRIFSKSVFVKAGIDLLKLGAIGGVLYVGTRALMRDPLFYAPVEAAYLGTFLNEATLSFLSRLLLALGVITAISYGYEKFKTSRELMMTRDQVKEEQRSAEGNAHLKAARRRLARRLVQKQMLSAVPTADVVITNPTHYAVALKYERGVDQAPVILAKGENRFALRIKGLAAEHGVPVVENKPVARLLYGLGSVGETIPSQLYQAVAEILAVVYRTHRFYFHQLKSRRLQAAAA